MVDLTTLNPQQRIAVETIKGPVLILAGAGTGKTRVITYRIAHMLSCGVAPGNILAVTFTNKAAREMKERVNQLVPRQARKGAKGEEEGESMVISTFHSLGARILRRYIDRLGYKRDFVIYNDSEQVAVVKKLLAQISSEARKVDPMSVLGMLSRMKNAANVSALDSEESAMASHIRSRYETALHACNAVDFDDLIVLTLKLFREHPDVLEACRARFRYVMVDEYQDTNGAQFEFVNHLTQVHRNLCVVGDDDQSIYGWRGAEIANLLDLEKHYPEVKVIKLEQNYRSTSVILNAANAVIKHNSRRRPKQLWSKKGEGQKITLFAFENEEEEAAQIVSDIECDRMARKIPWGERAILFRTNQQSRPLETALRKANVRYHLIGGQSYFDRREVKDVIAYLKMFLNPHDDNSLLRIANVPPRGLSDVTMERLLTASQERKCSVFSTMRHTDVLAGHQTRIKEAINEFVRLVEAQREAMNQVGHGSLMQWMERFLKDTGYIDDLRRGEKNPEIAENRVRNLKDLLASLDDASLGAAAPAERIQNFLENVTLDSSREEEKEEAGDAVTLITMHSCKGLEYPHVHVVGLEEGLLPHSRSALENSLDEERRLFYVAITRAMKTLTLSYCDGRKKYGQVMPCHPSRFIKELPGELLDWADPKASQPVKAEAGKSLFAAMRAAIGN